MFRRSLGEKEGMLFLYAEPQDVSMWMRNTYIPLDMVFVAKDGTVASIAERTIRFRNPTFPRADKCWRCSRSMVARPRNSA